jgi:hypothetical protein
MPINNPNALSAPLREACKAWLAAGDGAFWIVSGVRTYAEQVALYQAYLNGTGNLAARPGTSRHERGLAVDIGGDKTLAAQLAPRFGLGQTVSGEDWHYEVVDEATARTYPRGFTVDAEAKARFDQLDRNMAVLLERTSGQKKLLSRIWNKLKPSTPAAG